MKTKFLLCMAISALLALHACKTKEKVPSRNEKVLINNEILVNDTVINKDNKTAINDISKNKNEVVNADQLNKKKMNEDKIKDTIIDYEIINDPNLDPTPLKGYPINTPMPGIFTELFPDAKWELIYVNDGIEKMYRVSYLGKHYVYSAINEFIYSCYKQGNISEKKIIELFIYWFFLPEDNNMSIISIENCANCYGTANYHAKANINNETIDIYFYLVKSRILDFGSFKKGKLYRSDFISY